MTSMSSSARLSSAEADSSSDDASMKDSKRQKQTVRMRATDWLAARQEHGLHPRQSFLSNPSTRRSQSSSLSSTVAWNPRRMQNMILAVGPGTPASVCWNNPSDSDSSEDEGGQMILNDSSSENSDFEEEQDIELGSARMETGDENEDDSSDSSSEPEEEEEGRNRFRLRRRRRSSPNRVGGAARFLARRLELRRRLVLDNDPDSRGAEEEVDDDESDDSSDAGIFYRRRPRPDSNARHQRSSWQPSLRHGGCINTACWLDSPWRLSTVNEEGGVLSSPTAVEAPSDYPTQLITSGDDRVIKVWDVREAMGGTSPWTGGYDTLCPFATNTSSDRPYLRHVKESVYPAWKSKYQHRRNNTSEDDSPKVPGSVFQVATMSTGHRGNVFHVLPVNSQPGKLLTCAADGFLRLCDFQTGQSSVLVHPDHVRRSGSLDDDDDSYFPMLFSPSGMAFSHRFLSANTGLLCSERGLHRFDLRLSPREQSSRSLLLSDDESGWRNATCKACAVWSPFGTVSSSGEVESSYVFAGGASEVVCLYDLRMDGSTSRVLQRYAPYEFESTENASVSGLDVSRDGKELLVSYENDQIYAFPVVPSMSSASPTLQEIEYPSKFKTETGETLDYVPESACYGGHLNRFTFLKNAMYAGPNDEYICTGSDSGHAWIYERATGTVVSLLASDNCTCNGIIPHPTLPVFATYGIDSTAKLWRATEPVDLKVDDSHAGRVACANELTYEMSPVTRNWKGVQTLLKRYSTRRVFDTETSVMPDYIATSEEVANSGRFASSRKRGIDGYDSPRIGNAMRSLPSVSRQNRYECYRSLTHGESPIEHALCDFDHRVRLMRLRNQADRLGLRYDPNVPWIFQPGRGVAGDDVHPADLVPDNPSDWLKFHAEMTMYPVSARDNFNHMVYGDEFLIDRYDDPEFQNEYAALDSSRESPPLPWLAPSDEEVESCDAAASAEGEYSHKMQKSSEILYNTARILKEGGNQALNEGSLQSAARRYDKAIQYCAVAFMNYSDGKRQLAYADDSHFDLIPCDTKKKDDDEEASDSSDDERKRSATNRGSIIVWSPLLKILITSQLNMALLLLKPEFANPRQAADQAISALELLAPFVVHPGKVFSFRSGQNMDVHGKKHLCRSDEPVETYKEAKALQAKGFFRLGCAEMEMGEYKAAVKSLESSQKATKATNPHPKPDSLVARRLQEAKRKQKNKRRRNRKKFQELMRDEKPDEKKSGTEDDEPKTGSSRSVRVSPPSSNERNSSAS